MHKSWTGIIRKQCEQIKASEGVGIQVSNDAVNGRVLVTIAGSRTTVERGRDAVIRLLASDRRYRNGDIRLRRIRGHSVDTAGFEGVGSVDDEDLSKCKELFLWERYASGLELAPLLKTNRGTQRGKMWKLNCK